ncbi:MAG: 16S rRNA (cytosine(967)-C(5))-methyltransferase RsmB [Oscillospiraceae bacterium]|jgi:16S rRNA (cytosine967-C5)-methyltransferase|nr:16S rRNA (cytosine(967)-C(5))-methyltransferase RsmB [Oscillospiraceae bacterium]
MDITAREAARSALREYRRGAELKAAVEKRLTALSDARERALAKQIAYGTARNTALCDYYIASASKLGLSRLAPPILDILRAAVYQMAFLGKTPAFAVVNEAAEAARRAAGARAAGFVNAVLRRLAGDGFPEVRAESAAERLAILYSHPVRLVRELTAQLGEERAEAELEANNKEPPVYARANTLKITGEGLLARLRGEGIDARPGGQPAIIELHGAGEVASLGAFREGLFFAQDPSSARAALALGAGPGDIVVDACAAPGGKSFAAAMDMENKGRIIAFDTPGRTRFISDGARRLGIDIIETRARDAAEPIPELEGKADAVIADVPCSGFGVIRKKPDIRFKTDADTAGLPEAQLGILLACSSYVKPGGTLVYSTCTWMRRENDGVVEAFSELRGGAFELEGKTSLYAHSDGGDGFFYAVFRRKAL